MHRFAGILSNLQDVGKVGEPDRASLTISSLNQLRLDYRCVAEEHGLRWIDLPAEINLGSAAHADDYQKVHVILGFERFRSIGSERVGQPIVYAVTVPENAPHPQRSANVCRLRVRRVPQWGRRMAPADRDGASAATAYHATN